MSVTPKSPNTAKPHTTNETTPVSQAAWALPMMGPPPIPPLFAATTALGLDAMIVNIRAWRHMLDLSRDTIRAQQDAMLALARGALAEDNEKTSQAAAHTNRAAGNSLGSVTDAYGQIGEAWFRAQRSAFDALSPTNIPQ